VNLVISLDYEVYFGPRSGDVDSTLIQPTAALAALARRHGVPLVFFVDVLFLLRLREQARAHPLLQRAHDAVATQLQALVAAGHELQLHLHPHWLDAHWTGDRWQMDMRRYRLHALDDATLAQTVRAGADALRQFGGPVTAFRAGGWCLQPFDRLRAPLLAAGITIDSTVYAGGMQRGEPPADAGFDFRCAPELGHWTFDSDPLQPVPGGPFLEVPISSHPVSPLFFWRLAALRRLGPILGGARHRAAGNGQPMALARGELVRKLLWPSVSVVSIDGLKATFLQAAWQRHQRLGRSDFVVIGHPKAFTPYSLARLDNFLARRQHSHQSGLDGYRGLIAARPPAQWPDRPPLPGRPPAAQSRPSA